MAIGTRVAAFLRALPDHPLLDRLIRGRTWIALLGLMLAGIVAMQVEVLKLGASMGRAIERGTYLQGRNESLRASVATLADDQRIERVAAQRGMVMPAPSDVGFLSAPSGAAVPKAIANIRAPAAASFLTQTTGNGAVTTGAISTGPGTASTSTSLASGTSSTGPSAASASSSAAGGAANGATPVGGSAAAGTATTSSPAGSTSASTPSQTTAALAGGGGTGTGGG